MHHDLKAAGIARLAGAVVRMGREAGIPAGLQTVYTPVRRKMKDRSAVIGYSLSDCSSTSPIIVVQR